MILTIFFSLAKSGLGFTGPTDMYVGRGGFGLKFRWLDLTTGQWD